MTAPLSPPAADLLLKLFNAYDLFAGGGGVSTGIEAATGHPVTVAINHSPGAIAVHEANHAHTHHLISDVRSPLPTITAGGVDRRVQVRAFLAAYYGSDGKDVGQSLREPLRTVVTRDRFALVTVAGVEHEIYDIGHRMLHWSELLRAQFGRFAQAYDLSAVKTVKEKIKLLGNSVPPELVEALVRANISQGFARRAA
jgi:DNA (cytosine-5)-methyltransferase 1